MSVFTKGNHRLYKVVGQGGPWDRADRTRVDLMFGQGRPYFGTGQTVTRDEADRA
jgi:hypothetical protein